MKWSIVSFALLALSSCTYKEQQVDPTLGGFFAEDTGEVRKPTQFADVMAASGARADATLSRPHFDGGRLNSLGEEKLSLMLKDDDAAEPLRVYLNVDEKEPTSKPKRAAVVAFLKDGGLTEDQIEIVFGRNPENWHRSSTHLANLAKTETGTGAGAGESGTSNGGAKSATDGGTNELGPGRGTAAGHGSLFK